MKKYTIFILFFALVLSGCEKNSDKLEVFNDNDKSQSVVHKVNLSSKEEFPTSGIDQLVDRLEVYYFHRTQRCVSCLAMGKYIDETITQYFSEQTNNSLIDYRQINIDLAENKELARKFQASGSSLYVNAVRGENENIENIMEIWKLKSDEAQFKNFLKQKINTYLGI